MDHVATLVRDRMAPLVLACATGLRRGSDELTVAAGVAFVVVGVGMLSVAAAFMAGGIAVAAFGVGRLAYFARKGSS